MAGTPGVSGPSGAHWDSLRWRRWSPQLCSISPKPGRGASAARAAWVRAICPGRLLCVMTAGEIMVGFNLPQASNGSKSGEERCGGRSKDGALKACRTGSDHCCPAVPTHGFFPDSSFVCGLAGMVCPSSAMVSKLMEYYKNGTTGKPWSLIPPAARPPPRPPSRRCICRPDGRSPRCGGPASGRRGRGGWRNRPRWSRHPPAPP